MTIEFDPNQTTYTVLVQPTQSDQPDPILNTESYATAKKIFLQEVTSNYIVILQNDYEIPLLIYQNCVPILVDNPIINPFDMTSHLY